MREEDSKKEDPFEKKEARRVTVAASLQYAKAEEDLVKLQMNGMAEHWCEEEQAATVTRKVRNFSDDIHWRKDEAEDVGGCTWIELYVLYVIHGGARDEEVERSKDPLRNQPLLQKQIAEFKKAINNIKTFAINDAQEWQLQTTYSNKHRLKQPAIENRQAAIRGVPCMSEEDATNIMKMLLAMRGLDKQKHIEAWKAGELKIVPHKLRMQGAAQTWRKAVVHGNVWNQDEELSDPLISGSSLQEMICPACNVPVKNAEYET